MDGEYKGSIFEVLGISSSEGVLEKMSRQERKKEYYD